MTGSLFFNRQHSCTVGNCNEDKTKAKPKLRRSSSANEQKSNAEASEHNQWKKKLDNTNCQHLDDPDSGVEDLELQLEKDDGHLHSTKLDDAQELPTFCGTEQNEETVGQNLNNEDEHLETQNLEPYSNYLVLAGKISDDDKKYFCPSTVEVFHAEFARCIYFPIIMAYPHFKYHLFAHEELSDIPFDWPQYYFVKLDNAKVQFKCSNTTCQRSWTSMRARISFCISSPHSHGYVILKIVKQDCQICNRAADALWYMDEICRVMRNLSQTIFEQYSLFPIEQNVVQNAEDNRTNTNRSRRSRHDPHQRKGTMNATHDSSRCEACRIGWCFT